MIKLFYIDCVASLEQKKTYNQWQQTNMDSFLCHHCKYCSIIKPNDTPWEQLGHYHCNLKFQQLGLEYRNANTNNSRQLLRQQVNRIYFHYGIQTNQANYKTNLHLLNWTPISNPTLVNMNANLIEKHMLLGCRFKSSMLMYNIQQCHCCDMVRQHHMYTFAIIKETLLETLNWHIKCLLVCK